MNFVDMKMSSLQINAQSAEITFLKICNIFDKNDFDLRFKARS